MDYGVTDNGFVLKRFDTILAEIQESVSNSLGFDVALDPQSVINSAFIYPMADKFTELWEVAQASYYAKFPSTATGINLDNACQYGSVLRGENTASQYKLHCTGTDGTTVITEGAVVASDTSPSLFLTCVKDTTISRSSCNSIGITVSEVGTLTYTITLNNNAYTYQGQSTDTALSILNGLKTAFTESGYTATVDSTNVVLTIADETADRNNTVALTNNLTTSFVTTIVPFETENYGDVSIPSGKATKIVTNITGFTAVTNKIAYTPGSIEETDSEFRNSYISKIYLSASNQCESLRSYIMENVDGVESVSIFENQTDSTVSGRPPHSFETVVYGGENEQIADAIFTQKAAGIATYGSTSVTKQTSYGDTVTIKFSRPTNIYIWVRLVITASSAPSNYAELVKTSVMETAEGLYIGDDVLYQKFISCGYNAIPSATACAVYLGYTTTTSGTPTYSQANVTISETQIPLFAKSRIEVTLQ